MNHQEFAQLLGNYGEFVGAIAVVITLGYLAVQIRQNTTTSRAVSRQTLIDGWAATQGQFQNNPDLLLIYAKGITQWSTMPNTEKTQFDVGMAGFLGNIQNGIHLHEAGMLDQETLDTIASFMLTCIRCDGGAQWWKETGFATPQTREYLQNQLELGGGITAIELVPHWMAMATER
ncbi:MAG: hypothetical protein ACI9UU_001412 [Candidatus Azotimanducaceae bacterium]|jgi:hypothetical protein